MTALLVVLSNALTASLVASWLKSDYLHRLASIGAKPMGMQDGQLVPAQPHTPLVDLLPQWLGEPTRELQVRPAPTVERHWDTGEQPVVTVQPEFVEAT